MTSEPPEFTSTNNQRNFSFNQYQKAAVFFREEGVYQFSQYKNKSVKKLILSQLPSFSILVVALVLLVLKLVPFLYFFVGVMVAVVLGGTLQFRVMHVVARKMPKGSSFDEWVKSGAIKRFYRWEDVKKASMRKSIGSGKFISLMLGKEFKSRRSILIPYSEDQYNDLNSFLSEKIADRLKS